MVDPATVYVVADASLLAIVEIIRPDDADVSPVNPAPVLLLLSRNLTRIMFDVDPFTKASCIDFLLGSESVNS